MEFYKKALFCGWETVHSTTDRQVACENEKYISYFLNWLLRNLIMSFTVFFFLTTTEKDHLSGKVLHKDMLIGNLNLHATSSTFHIRELSWRWYETCRQNTKLFLVCLIKRDLFHSTELRSICRILHGYHSVQQQMQASLLKAFRGAAQSKLLMLKDIKK